MCAPGIMTIPTRREFTSSGNKGTEAIPTTGKYIKTISKRNTIIRSTFSNTVVLSSVIYYKIDILVETLKFAFYESGVRNSYSNPLPKQRFHFRQRGHLKIVKDYCKRKRIKTQATDLRRSKPRKVLRTHTQHARRQKGYKILG